MQRIDYFIGIPICFLLSIFNTIISFLGFISKKSPSKVVFIELSEMGSAFLAYPMLKRAVEKFGAQNVYFLIFTKNRESVDLLNVIPYENVITISDKNLLSFVVDSLKAIFKLRSYQIDTCVDMELFSRATAILSYLSGASIRVGFDNFTDEGLYRGSFITNRVFLNNHHHISVNFLALYEGIFCDTSELPQVKKDVSEYMCDLPDLRKDKNTTELVWENLEKLNSQISRNSKIVVLNPDPGLLALRGWSTDSYMKVSEKLLSNDSNLFIVLMGLPRSSNYAELVFPKQFSDRCINYCGQTRNLDDVISLFTISHLLITNDSGPGHLASLSRIQSIVLFGPESPAKYGPLGREVTSVFANLSCSPCYSAANHRYSICNNNICLQAISVNQVYKIANEKLYSSN
jgi:ADP-heptose:LPS heptosyltransferase